MRRVLGWLGTACALVVAAQASAQVGSARAWQKISATEGGFGGSLSAADFFGYAHAALGDLDGDGVDDLAVGAVGVGTRRGAVWILFLDVDGSVKSQQEIASGIGGLPDVLADNDLFGCSLARLGDLDGDGTTELAVGAEGNEAGGGLWILFLHPNGTVKATQKIQRNTGGFGFDITHNLGCSLAPLGDLDGDGNADLCVGSHDSVFNLFLEPDGTVKAQERIGSGFALTFFFGYSVSVPGDLNGDGRVELAVSAPRDDDGGSDTGAVWILFLNASGGLEFSQKISATAGGFGGTLAPNDSFGAGLAAPGDLDGDGVEDLAVVASSLTANQIGRAWILFLKADGSVKSEAEISDGVGGFDDDINTSDRFAYSVSAGLDLDGDGVSELVLGSHRDDDGGYDHGAVYVLFLKGRVRIDFETEDDFTTALVNGQDISTPPEFGNLVAITSSGPNARAALFDSTPGGPNDPSQDRDLLVGSGKILILQGNDNTTQTVPGIFDRPNDDEDGGVLSFSLTGPVMLESLDLVDIDAGADEATSVILTDLLGRRRVYAVPPNWTGDRFAGQPGIGTLDLTTLGPQPGFASTATASQDASFTPAQVVRLEVRLGSSGAVDNLVWCPYGSAEVHSTPHARRR